MLGAKLLRCALQVPIPFGNFIPGEGGPASHRHRQGPQMTTAFRSEANYKQSKFERMRKLAQRETGGRGEGGDDQGRAALLRHSNRLD